MSGRIVQISVSGGVPKTRATSARVTVSEGLAARVLATGSIRASDRVWLLTGAEAARMRVPART